MFSRYRPIARLFLVSLLLSSGCSQKANSNLANATYKGIAETPITLTDGQWVGPPYQPGGAVVPRLELIDYLQASGDLNHDGQIDTAVILSYSPGGSGIFVYLAIMTSRGARPINLDTKLLGDRVQVRSIDITNDLLVVDLLQHGDGDPSCCPGEVALYQFHLENDQIAPASSPLQTFRLSLATLEGKSYQLHHADLPDEFVSLPIVTLTVQDSVMTALCGCRSYQMAVDEQQVPGDIVVRDPITPIDSCNSPDTDTDCMYLSQLLPRIYRYGWQQGRLTFSYETSGTYGNLYFSVDDH